MKKSVYWLAMLMLGLSCALWTGCSDDDNESEGEGNGENGGNVSQETTTTLKVQDNYDEETTNYVFTWQDERVTKVLEENVYLGWNNVTEAEETVKDTTDYSITYGEGTAVVTFKDKGDDETQEITYTFNDKGYVSAAVYKVVGSTDRPVAYSFTYNAANDKLEKVKIDANDQILFEATYPDNSTNWDLYKIYVPGGNEDDEDDENSVGGEVVWNAVELDCNYSQVKNDCYMNLNMLALLWGDDEVLDCAILYGWLPVNSNVLGSLDMDESPLVAMTASPSTGKVSTLTVESEDLELDLEFTIGY